ncbi:MAG: hypothetical protein M3Q39_15030 [Actinomycetota bacterium]|nr:hypothetical protein [Actinomycetota bacterium]
MRDIVAVVVAVDSPAGRAAEAIDQLTAHLPPPDEPWACPLCSAQSWPCAGFDAAAHRVQAAHLRIVELVPLDLRPRLWPPQQPGPPETPAQSAPRERGPHPSAPHPTAGSDEEQPDG